MVFYSIFSQIIKNILLIFFSYFFCVTWDSKIKYLLFIFSAHIQFILPQNFIFLIFVYMLMAPILSPIIRQVINLLIFKLLKHNQLIEDIAYILNNVRSIIRLQDDSVPDYSVTGQFGPGLFGPGLFGCRSFSPTYYKNICGFLIYFYINILFKLSWYG